MAITILKIEEYVTHLLEKHPHTRDDDNKLVSNFWYKELGRKGMKLSDMSATEFMKMYADGELTNSESITRCRRKLQEHNPELRGSKWKERHDHQDDIKKELGYTVTDSTIKGQGYTP